MSAFSVSDAHLSYLVSAAEDYGVVEFDKVDRALAMLREANNVSVATLYPKDAAMQAPAPAAHKRVPVEPIQVLKAIRCYAYQACEDDGWHTSPAKRFCDMLTAHAVSALPGYREATWEIH